MRWFFVMRLRSLVMLAAVSSFVLNIALLSGPGVLALFDAPWATLYLAIITLMHPLAHAETGAASRDARRRCVAGHRHAGVIGRHDRRYSYGRLHPELARCDRLFCPPCPRGRTGAPESLTA
jgi:hypothetical protein